MYLVYRHFFADYLSDEIVCSCVDYDVANRICKFMNKHLSRSLRKHFVYDLFDESALERHSKKLYRYEFVDPENDLPF